jgi:cell division protein ZipA
LGEFRWILLGLGVVLLGGIWWWGARRSRQLPGDAQLREMSAGATVDEPAVTQEPAVGEYRRAAESRDWGVPPLEPLSIRTADFDEVQVLDFPMTASADPIEDDIPSRATPPPPAPSATSAQSPPSAQPASSAPQPANGATQRIVTLRVCAAGESQWAGAALLAALESQDLHYGRYKVFHRTHGERTLFCAASLVEPGTFDLGRMPGEQYRGLSLFAVLPGPADALETIDVLVATAVHLAEMLGGVVQDSTGALLSMQRAEALREDVARFQMSLTMT